MDSHHQVDLTPQFPIPLDRIANEFHLSVTEIEQFLKDRGAPIGNICGKPAIEPHYYVLAFRQTCCDLVPAGKAAQSKAAQNKQEVKPKTDMAEIDRIIDSLPPERIDKELLETTGPMKVSEVATYLDKSVPVINKMWKNGQLYRIPNSSPNLICPRSVILFAAGITDPRLKDE